MYAFILELEVLLFMKYKVQVTEVEDKMTMLDFQSFVQILQNKNDELEKNQPKDNFTKQLVNLRDMLNYMTLHDTRIR